MFADRPRKSKGTLRSNRIATCVFLKNLSVARKARVGRHQPRVNFSSIFEAKLDDGDCGRGAGAIPPHVYAVQGTNDPDIALATPEEALAALYAGNKRFVTGQVNAAYRDMDRVKAIAPKSTPFAAFLGCADSRVPIEMVFDQGLWRLVCHSYRWQRGDQRKDRQP